MTPDINDDTVIGFTKRVSGNRQIVRLSDLDKEWQDAIRKGQAADENRGWAKAYHGILAAAKSRGFETVADLMMHAAAIQAAADELAALLKAVRFYPHPEHDDGHIMTVAGGDEDKWWSQREAALARYRAIGGET